MVSVVVNGVAVPEEAINLESAYVEEGAIEEKRQEAARRLVICELLRQRAEAIGIETQGRVDAAIDELLAAEVPVPQADDAACRRYFEANRDRFRTPDEIELRHILLPAAPDAPSERTQARDRAEELVALLRKAPARFPELAGRHSRCPSAAAGGHLGVIGRGQTVPELEKVVLRLPVGLAERPIETRYGFHVVEILGRAGGIPLAYDNVRHLIADYLRERSWRRAVSQYVGQLAARAEIEGVDLQVPDSMLVQ